MTVNTMIINYLLFIGDSRKLVRSLTCYKFFSAWRNRDKIKFHELYSQGKFEEAISFGERALKKRENAYYLRRKLAKAYRNLGHHDIAAIKLGEDLSNTFGKDPSLVIFQIENEITKNLENGRIKSKFIYLGGMNNYGQVHHEIISKKTPKGNYITKIATPEKIKSEVYFYSKICKENSQLKSVAAKFLGYFESESRELAFLTLGKIVGSPVELENMQEVINTHKLLTSACSFRHNMDGSRFEFSMNRGFMVSNVSLNNIQPILFSAIHRREANLEDI